MVKAAQEFRSCTLPDLASGATIAAIATATGPAGIGIVRISGKCAAEVAGRLFRPRRKTNNSGKRKFSFQAHRLHYGHICDPVGGKVIDEVLLAFMPAPHSYTRENVVEIQSHGGPVLLGRVLELVLQNGARLAEPGEFTKRAFLNGRLDLTQAEAVADLINASNQSELHLAAAQLEGGLKKRIQQIIDRLDGLTADLEARIEFPEEIEPVAEDRCREVLSAMIMGPIQALIDSYQEGKILREGLRVAIVGRPNVGKSSLLNRLIGEEKAIVTPLPGTTRDPVEAGAIFNGISLWFSDTAGIHAGQDLVEKIGIRKSQETLDRADLVLLMIDATQPEHAGDQEVFACCRRKKSILVINKIDLAGSAAKIEPPRFLRQLPAAHISALHGNGIEGLKGLIASSVSSASTGHSEREGGAIVANLRHHNALVGAVNSLRSGLQGLENGLSEDLIVLDLRRAGDSLRDITGERCDQELLDYIFQRFCIGK